MLKCDNCERVFESEDELEHRFPEIPKLCERVDPGELVPYGTCPDCDALVHETTKKVVTTMSDTTVLCCMEEDGLPADMLNFSHREDGRSLEKDWEASLEKVFWSEYARRLADAALDLLGFQAQLQVRSPGARQEMNWGHEALWVRAGTILAGTSEIQRNIIAKRILKL